jgi:hypothetical protein
VHAHDLLFLPKFAPMASDGVLEVSTKQRKTSADQLEESLAGRQTEAILEQDVESDHESQFGDSRDSGDC